MVSSSRNPRPLSGSRRSAFTLLRVWRADVPTTLVRIHHQNSPRLARPRNVAYLRKNLRIASCQDAPYSGSSRCVRDPGGVASVMRRPYAGPASAGEGGGSGGGAEDDAACERVEQQPSSSGVSRPGSTILAGDSRR